MAYRGFVAAITLAVLTPVLNAQQKQAIGRADQLPAHSYAITTAPSALVGDEAALSALIRSLRADLQSDLAKYDSGTLPPSGQTFAR